MRSSIFALASVLTSVGIGAFALGAGSASSLVWALGPLSETERRMEALGLVDVARVDSTIVVELVYATADNFVGEVLYEDISRAFLDPEAAEALVRAQRILAERRPGLRLIVYDAARPMSVQARMHDMVAGTEKHIYVSDPAKGGGLHNYGLAVDVSIVDGDGVALDMGTAFDHLGFEANIDREGELVARGIISEAARRNRVLLREVMGAAGYMALRSEWWHFNFRSRAVAVEGYLVIE